MGQIIVGIDIGTSKVCTVIGQVNRDNQVEILGRGMEPCNGVKKGVIIDIESTANAIKNSVERAESMANVRVGSAYVNIMGTHVSIISKRSGINVANENREISAKDVEKVIYAAKDVEIPEDRQIIDIIPRQYIIDGYDEIIDPVGMVGLRLEVDTDVVAGKITSVQNIVKSMEKAGLKIDGLVVEAMASGEILLTVEEKEMGVILIDVGGGITDISVFQNKKLVFYDSLPIGGDHITSDISIGLKIPYAEAEKIKRQYELALTSLIKNDQEFSVNEINDNRKKTVRVSEVVEIIEARVYEIFSLCHDLLNKSNIVGNYGAGVVLSGGGISYVDGSTQLANEVFEIPARVAACKTSVVSKPEYATAAGIIKYVSSNSKGSSHGSEIKIQKQKTVKSESGFFKKLSKIFSDFF